MTKTRRMSRHAQMRRKQMRVTEAQIDDAISDPETVYPGSNRHPGERTCYQRGPLVVVVERDEIVTVLWHRKECR